MLSGCEEAWTGYQECDLCLLVIDVAGELVAHMRRQMQAESLQLAFAN